MCLRWIAHTSRWKGVCLPCRGLAPLHTRRAPRDHLQLSARNSPDHVSDKAPRGQVERLRATHVHPRLGPVIVEKPQAGRQRVPECSSHIGKKMDERWGFSRKPVVPAPQMPALCPDGQKYPGR